MALLVSDQGSNLCSLHWQEILNHWDTREVLIMCFSVKLPLALENTESHWTLISKLLSVSLGPFFSPKFYQRIVLGFFLVVQWLRLCTPNAGSTSLIPNWETKIPDVVRCSQNLKSNEKDSEVLFPTSAQFGWELLCI